MTPEITVLMPVHNAAAYVRESAQSILEQSFRDFELLVVDDASTDDTIPIIKSLDDPRIRVIGGKDRLGFSGALNAGLEQARGTFVARMDGDDIALPDRLAAQHEFLVAHPEVGLCGGRATVFGMGQGQFARPPLSHREILSHLLFDNPIVHPSVMFRRESFQRNQLRYDPAFCPSDDYDLWSRAARLFPIVNLDRVVLRYRVHGESLTKAHWGDMDKHAARVAGRELAALGLCVDDETLHFHRNLGRGRCFPIRERRELERAESWLETLLAANVRNERFPVPEFRRSAARVWYGACYHAGALGGWMVARFARSRLRQVMPTSAKEWGALLKVAALRTSN